MDEHNYGEYEANANVTTTSIERAACVLRLVADEARVPSEQYGRYLEVASRLDEVAEARRDSNENDSGTVIPIPAEAMNEEAMTTVVEHVHGMAEEEINE